MQRTSLVPVTLLAICLGACGARAGVDAPSEPEREFASAFDGPPVDAKPYPSDLGPLASVPQARVYTGTYIMTDARVGFVPACARYPRGAHFEVGRFRIMAYEVSRRAYARCVAEKGCPGRPADMDRGDPNRAPVSSPARELEPVSVPAASAEAFCRAYGGELPTQGQWYVAAHATDGRVGPRWVTDRLPACFIDDRDPQCREFQVASDHRPTMAAGEPLYPLRNVGATPWDVSPEGVFDLYGNAFEWLREPSRELPIVETCEGPVHSEAEYYRGPRAPRSNAQGPMQVLPARVFNSVWLYWQPIPPQNVLALELEPFDIGGPTPAREEFYYRNGFRCVFPEEKP